MERGDWKVLVAGRSPLHVKLGDTEEPRSRWLGSSQECKYASPTLLLRSAAGFHTTDNLPLRTVIMSSFLLHMTLNTIPLG